MARAFSIEDANLFTTDLITTRNRAFSDMDLTFKAKTSGELFKKTDASAVKQAVKTLVQTNFYERPFQPFFGANVRALLFELADDETEIEVRDNIVRAIEQYEPRAEIVDVSVKSTPDANTLDVTIVFRIINSNELVTLRTSVTRLR